MYFDKNKGAFKYYISISGGVQNLGKTAYIILARSLKYLSFCYVGQTAFLQYPADFLSVKTLHDIAQIKSIQLHHLDFLSKLVPSSGKTASFCQTPVQKRIAERIFKTNSKSIDFWNFCSANFLV